MSDAHEEPEEPSLVRSGLRRVWERLSGDGTQRLGTRGHLSHLSHHAGGEHRTTDEEVARGSHTVPGHGGDVAADTLKRLDDGRY